MLRLAGFAPFRLEIIGFLNLCQKNNSITLFYQIHHSKHIGAYKMLRLKFYINIEY